MVFDASLAEVAFDFTAHKLLSVISYNFLAISLPCEHARQESDNVRCLHLRCHCHFCPLAMVINQGDGKSGRLNEALDWANHVDCQLLRRLIWHRGDLLRDWTNLRGDHTVAGLAGLVVPDKVFNLLSHFRLPCYVTQELFCTHNSHMLLISQRQIPFS